MRLQLKLEKADSTKPLPFDHQPRLTGAIHKWLGPDNPLHDGPSLYSFGWLRGEKETVKDIYFEKEISWNISFFDSQYAWQLARGILKDPMLMPGVKVEKVLEEPIPMFGEAARFLVDGFVMARTKRPNGSREYLFWNDPRADVVLTGLLRQKLRLANFGSKHLETTVEFDRTYRAAIKKSVFYRNVKHHGSLCPVIVRGTPEAVRFAYLVGVGDLTGSGFGALR